jgi:hypothetical protein
MRRLLLASVAAGALLLALPQARADISDGEYQAGIDALLDAILTHVDLPAWVNQLLALLGLIGGGNSYLGPGGADLEVLYPSNPDLGSPNEGIGYGDLRYQDRQARVTEAMDVAAEVMTQLPFNALELKTLQTANLSPASLVAAIQIGNEINLRTTEALHKQNAILAELGQLEADQRMKEDYDAFAFADWKRQHYPQGWLNEPTTVAAESYQLQY